MSLGDGQEEDEVGVAPDDVAIVHLRALAHPLRLRILSLLTGASMTAAEVARELDLTHANASYHLRHLAAGGIIAPAGEERINGGVAKRYRYDLDRAVVRHRASKPKQDYRLMYAALAAELQRRAALLRQGGKNHMTDAELWVDPQVWREVQDLMIEASQRLHRAAQPPHAEGTIHVNATLALFEME